MIGQNVNETESAAMIKKHVIYKHDNWNMLTVEVNGTRYIARVISDQWGEDTFTFLSRSALIQWGNDRFSKDKFEGSEDERLQIIDAFEQV
jgi:hypothetical protein